MTDDDRLQRILDRLPHKAGAPARPFWTRQETVESPPSQWKTAIIHILEGDTEIGSYRRNIAGYGEQTFEPFELNGRWYALYSSDYTATRVMSLPDCRDLGGEEPASDGFCPVELFVPRYRSYFYTHSSGEVSETWYFESEGEPKQQEEKGKWGAWKCLEVGFVAGCVWGDDSSWKLEVVDLSMADKGIIRRNARFGHFEIAADLPLASAVQLSRSLPHRLEARVLREERRDIETGKRIDPYNEELID